MADRGNSSRNLYLSRPFVTESISSIFSVPLAVTARLQVSQAKLNVPWTQADEQIKLERHRLPNKCSGCFGILFKN